MKKSPLAHPQTEQEEKSALKLKRYFLLCDSEDFAQCIYLLTDIHTVCLKYPYHVPNGDPHRSSLDVLSYSADILLYDVNRVELACLYVTSFSPHKITEFSNRFLFER